ncbi:hypothetical protein GCM10020000_54980 [Streptomyces olivoverticillatus]
MLHVHDDVDVVQQHPAGVAVALAAHGLGAELLEQPLLDLVDDRLDLAVVGGADASRKASVMESTSLTS